ncbi:MAG: GMC oxidoreductase, partial [Novosphingobium sp.]|nr:GMC oxidoreductase [Novosphingobium sp.]
DTYLKPGLRAGTLTVLSQAQALKVDFENGQATGVTFLHDGEVRSAHAAQEVILSAGAINSTQLLLLSGIGPAAELEAAGIPVIADSPEVGHNLQNHAAYLMDFACSAPVTAYRYMHPLRGPASALRYAFQRNGILASPPGPAGGLLNVAPGAVAPDVQLILGSGLPDPKRRGLMAGLPSRHGFRFMLNQGRPYSRGRVRLRSASPLDAPLIEPGYFEDPRDLETLRLAMERAREIAAAPALAKVVEAELKPGPAVQGKAAIEAAIRRWGTNHYHPAGTCRMGSDDRAVVDTQLRVRGVERLRIADTAIMPLLVNGNTGASALMIGERAAALMQS